MGIIPACISSVNFDNLSGAEIDKTAPAIANINAIIINILNFPNSFTNLFTADLKSLAFSPTPGPIPGPIGPLLGGLDWLLAIF